MTMLSQEKFSKLADPEFYLDFASRYVRAGEHCFDTLELLCSFFGSLLSMIIPIILLKAGIGETHEIKNVPFIYWIWITASFLILIYILFHTSKERPRWRIARYYQSLARNDIYELQKAYLHTDSIAETETLMNRLRTFKEKFPIKENALAAIIYNECLVARERNPQLLHVTARERLFPRFTAFLGK